MSLMYCSLDHFPQGVGVTLMWLAILSSFISVFWCGCVYFEAILFDLQKRAEKVHNAYWI